MARQIINTDVPNSKGGTPIRDSFNMCNQNFAELYSPAQVVFSGDEFRIVIRSGALCIDQTITPTGFDGVEDVDWEELQSFKRP